jgi:hypothetical protein
MPESFRNATALHRAEAAYVELIGDARAALGEAIAHFSGVLESQDVRRIDEERRALLALRNLSTRMRQRWFEFSEPARRRTTSASVG